MASSRAGTAPVGCFDHRSIQASAGSGKTFQLTNRYLALTAAGADPSSILATTFTRVAAGQIRDRVLERLAEAAGRDDKRAELAGHIQIDGLGQDDVGRMLQRIVRHLHRVQIRTLDSFFAAVVQAFALELGLPLGAQIVDEHREAMLRDEAIRRMLDEREPQPLIDLLRLLTQGAADRAVMEAIDAAVGGLHALYLDTDEAAWHWQEEPDGRLSPPRLVEAIQALEATDAPADHTSMVIARAKDLERAWAQDWSAFIENGLSGKIAQGETTYRRRPIPAPLLAAYLPVVRHARAVLLGRVRNQTRATRALLEHFHEQYERIKRRQCSLSFTDLPAALARAADLGTIDEILFRLDGRVRHLLLDEFQDTSVRQWRALKPFVAEVVAHAPPDYSLFCVGDAKQSIYGWRDAAPDVLREMPNLLRAPDGSSAVVEDTLTESWRSSPVIISAVNRVFQSIQATRTGGEHPDAFATWLRGFKEHQTVHQDLAGRVELRTVRRAEGSTERLNVRLAAAADLAQEFFRRDPGLEVGILTRKNEAVQQLLGELGPTGRQLPASGRGGGPLTDAPAVNVLLDLLRLADHPDDTVAAFDVARSPLGAMVGLEDHASVAARHRVARDLRRRLLEDGYGRTIGQWAIALAGACDARELRRVFQLVELAERYDPLPSLRTRDFVRLVEQTNVADTQPAPIKVMTLHQAKGLEFDAVILPELDVGVTGVSTPTVLVERAGPVGRITRVSRAANKGTRALDPGLQALYAGYESQCVRDSLSLLYVAMTRARQALFMLIDPAKERERTIPSTLAGMLRETLSAVEAPPEQLLFEDGDPGWIDQPRPKREEEEQAPTAAAQRPAPVAPAPIRLAPATGASIRPLAPPPSVAAGDDLIGAALAPLTAEAEAAERGLAIHAMCEQIRWIDEFDLDDATLTEIARQIAPRRGRDWASRQVRTFRESIARPAVREMLSRPPGGDTIRDVFRELPFARFVDGRLQQGRIDRLVVESDESGPCRATVIDFKTDQISPEDVPASAEAYRDQLQTYGEAVGERCGLEPELVDLRLVFLHVGVVAAL